MKKQILAFGASNSHTSINRQLAIYTASQFDQFEITAIDLNDFEMPIYSIDRETAKGIPNLAQEFKDLIRNADGFIISFAEHNGSYTAAYKNIFDWVSRIEKSVWHEKPMLLMATSPGGRGGQNVLQLAVSSYGRKNDNVLHFSLPSFHQNFSPESGITDPDLNQKHKDTMETFKSLIS